MAVAKIMNFMAVRFDTDGHREYNICGTYGIVFCKLAEFTLAYIYLYSNK